MTRTAATALLLFALVLCTAGGVSAQDEGIEKAAEEMRKRALEAGSAAGTIGPLKEFVTKYPGRHGETVWLAQALMQERMFPEAAELLEGANRRWPRNFQITEMLGTAYLELGRPGEAVAAWHSILGDSESYVARYRQVSRLEWNAGMFDRAIETLKEARRFEKHYRTLTRR